MVEGLDGIKYSYNNGYIAADSVLACENFIKALDTMPKLIAKHTEQNEQLAKDLPVLQEVVNGLWPKDAELQGIHDELAALNRKIALDLAPIKEHSTDGDELPQEIAPDNVMTLYPPAEEQKMVAGSDIVPDPVVKSHVASRVVVLQPGGGHKL